MSSYHARRSYRYRSWSPNPPSKYSRLQDMFGQALEKIKTYFFSMDEEAMNDLLIEYGRVHGKSAETYARKTMEDWRQGNTKLSGQTMERLVELVPPCLTAEQRLEILTDILEKNEQPTSSRTIQVNIKDPEPGLSEIDKALEDIKITDELAFLPKRVMDAAQWLYNDDISAARSMLISIAAADTQALKNSSQREINLLKRTLQSGQIQSANYTVKTPAGDLHIIAYTPTLLSRAKSYLFGS